MVKIYMYITLFVSPLPCYQSNTGCSIVTSLLNIFNIHTPFLNIFNIHTSLVNIFNIAGYVNKRCMDVNKLCQQAMSTSDVIGVNRLV